MAHTKDRTSSGPTVVVISRSSEANLILKRKIETLRSETPDLNVETIHPSKVSTGIGASTDAVILNMADWSPTEAITLFDVRSTGYKGPILVLAKVLPNDATRVHKSLGGVMFLEKPFDKEELFGIVRRMIGTPLAAQRSHRRYVTNEVAEIEISASEKGKLSKVVNLSQGGAYIEFFSNAQVRIGDVVQMKIELKELQKTYNMKARVAWVSKSSRTGGPGVGVEFMGAGQLSSFFG